MFLRQKEGLSQEAAYERIGREITRRYREWYLALAELPQWGEAVDVQVQKYVRALQDLVLSNLNWRYVSEICLQYDMMLFFTDCVYSFRSRRYFGKGNELARRERLVPAVHTPSISEV